LVSPLSPFPGEACTAGRMAGNTPGVVAPLDRTGCMGRVPPEPTLPGPMLPGPTLPEPALAGLAPDELAPPGPPGMNPLEKAASEVEDNMRRIISLIG